MDKKDIIILAAMCGVLTGYGFVYNSAYIICAMVIFTAGFLTQFTETYKGKKLIMGGN